MNPQSPIRNPQSSHVGPIGAWNGDENEPPAEVAAATIPRTGASVLDSVLRTERAQVSTADLDMRDHHPARPGAAWAAWQAHEEKRAISEAVLAAHEDQVSRLTRIPPTPPRGTLRWSVMLGGWQFEPETEDCMDCLIDLARGAGIKVTIHI